MTSISNINQFGSIAKLQKLPSATPSETKKVDTKSAAQTHADKKAEGYLQADQIQDLLTLGKVKNIATQGAPAAIGGMISSFPIEKSIMKKQLKAANEASGGKTEEKKEGNALFNRFRLFPDEDNKYELITGSTLNLMGHFTEGGSVGIALACLGNYMGWFDKAKGVFGAVPFIGGWLNKAFPASQKVGERAEGLLSDGLRYAVVKEEGKVQKVFHAGPMAKLLPWFYKNPVAIVTENSTGFVVEELKAGKEKVVTVLTGEKEGVVKMGKDLSVFIKKGGKFLKVDEKASEFMAQAEQTVKQVKGEVGKAKNIFEATFRYFRNIGKNCEVLPQSIINNIKAGIKAEMVDMAPLANKVDTFFVSNLNNIKMSGNEGIFKLLRLIPSFDMLIAAFTFGGVGALLYNLFEHGAVQIQMPGMSAGKGGAHGE
jgi:hypothetical protein